MPFFALSLHDLVPAPLDSGGTTTLRVDSELKSLVAEKRAMARSIVAIRQRVADAADSVLVAISNVQGESVEEVSR